jgi:hypothetical protein
MWVTARRSEDASIHVFSTKESSWEKIEGTIKNMEKNGWEDIFYWGYYPLDEQNPMVSNEMSAHYGEDYIHQMNRKVNPLKIIR